MVSFDRIDKLILQRLMEDGRASFSQIARETKLTDVAIKKRFERLKRQNLIHGVRAELNYDSLGYSKPIYALLKADPAKITSLERKFADMDFVLEYAHVLGNHNFVLKLLVPDFPKAKKMVEDLGKLDGVLEINSMAVLSETRKTNSLPAIPLQKKLFAE